MVETLIERLRGIYRIPITDGLGAVGAGEEPDNPNEFVRKFETAPIQHEAADRLEALERENKELRKKLADERIVAEKAHEADAKAFLAAITRAETAERQLAEAQGWAKEWHRTCETIATLMDLPEPEGATFAQAVSDKLAERDADLARKNALLLKASVGFEPFSEVGNAMTFAGVTANDEIELAGERLRPALVAAVTIKREIDLVIAVPASPSTAGER